MSAPGQAAAGGEHLGPLLAGISAELRALRQELLLLRQEQVLLRQALEGVGANGEAGLSAVPQARAAQGARLNQEVWRRLEAGGSSDSDTTMDLLIDQLHDLALENGA
ncbi:MAG: hypothetical protein R6W06_10875 [Prochlorococcaceae cyanobacterium]